MEEGLDVLMYITLFIYTLYIWVTFINRLRQKRRKAALQRFLGFLLLYGIAILPLLPSFSRFPSDLVLGSFLFLIPAIAFSKNPSSKTATFSRFSTSIPTTSMQQGPNQTSHETPVQVKHTPEFIPQPIIAPQEVRSLEQQSKYLWSNYKSTLTEKFWDDYEAILVQMKTLTKN